MFAARNGGKRKPFSGIVLTDTFNATGIDFETERRIASQGGLLQTFEEEAKLRGEVEDEIAADADNGQRLDKERKASSKSSSEPALELARRQDEMGPKGDFTRLIYNEKITISEIPADAEKYVVNGRSPLGWAIDRYQVKKDKDSGIVNDPNDWASENPRYILDLISRLVTVALETQKIVKSLLKLLED